jgi:hypothetical protein
MRAAVAWGYLNSASYDNVRMTATRLVSRDNYFGRVATPEHANLIRAHISQRVAAFRQQQRDTGASFRASVINS